MPDGSAPRPQKTRILHGAAFKQLYRDNYAFVWRYVRHLGFDASAEDAAQEVFVVAYRRRHTFAGPSIRAWLAGIARKVVFRLRRTDQRRQRRHDALAQAEAVHESQAGDLDNWLQRKEAAVFLEQFLADLAPDKRSAFILYELEGLKGREVAAALQINPNTAHARLRAARALFAEACAEAQRSGMKIGGDQLGEVYRDAKPASATIKRNWVAFVAQTGWTAGGAAGSATAATGLASWAGQLKVAALTIAIGGTGLVAADQLAAPTSTAAPATETASAKPTRAQSATVDVATVATAGVPAPSPAAAPESTLPPPAPNASPPGNSESRTTTTQPSAEELSRREYELLRNAQRAQRKGEWKTALAWADQLLAKHPNTKLAPEATLVRVKAHCRLQQRQQALHAAEDLDAAVRRALLDKYCD